MSDNIYAAFERMFYRPLFSTVHTGIVRHPRKQSLSIRPACPDNRLRFGGLGDDDFSEPSVHVFAGGILVAPQFFL